MRATRQATRLSRVYLTENRLTAAQIHKTIKRLYIKEVADISNFPSADAMRRLADVIPKPVVYLMRFGDSVFRDKCAPYISREYESIGGNDIWVGDNHTIDVKTEYIIKDASPEPVLLSA